MRVRLPKHRSRKDGVVAVDSTGVEIDVVQLDALTTVFSPPRWLRDLGRAAWLLVGVFALLAGLIWLLAVTYTIVGPLVAAAIVATVAMPLVARLSAHMPRAAAAGVVLLAFVALGVFIVVIVIGGITGQEGEIGKNAAAAADKAKGWLHERGRRRVRRVERELVGEVRCSRASSPTLATGVIDGIKGLTSVVFGLSLAVLSLFFLLKDGPSMRGWVDRHLGVPQPVAQTITGGVITVSAGVLPRRDDRRRRSTGWSSPWARFCSESHLPARSGSSRS